LHTGGTAPAVLNAANEVAVEAFLNKKIPFLDIPRLIRDVLMAHSSLAVNTLEDVLMADKQARESAQEWILQ